MNKRSKILSFSLSFSLLLGIGVVAQNKSKNFGVFSEANSYTITFDGSSALKLTSAEAAAKECVRYTALRNPINFKIDACSSSSESYFGNLTSDGYIRNSDPLHGIRNIKIVASHRPFTVNIGTTYGTYSLINTYNSELNENLVEYDCPIVDIADYFSIETPYTSEQDTCYIKSVVVTYSCRSTQISADLSYT